MENNACFVKDDALVPGKSCESDVKVSDTLPMTKQQGVLSSANHQDADDEISIPFNPRITPQEGIDPSRPAETNLQHMKSRSPSNISPDESNRFPGFFITDSEDESDSDALLWCRATKRNHGELMGWGLSRCPSCGQRFNKPRPKPLPRMPKAQGADSGVSTDSKAHRRSEVKYSNRILWGNGTLMYSEPWPELLDLNRDRGKLAVTNGPSDEPVLEIVTIVATNLESNSRSRRDTNWIISNASVGAQCVGKEVIIHSRRVMDALQTLVTYYPQFDLGGMSLLISQPYAIFYHHLNEIREFQRTYRQLKENQPGAENPNTALTRTHLKVCDAETYKDLNIVREFIERENLTEVDEEMNRHQQSPAVATYSMLWLLFKPGTKVYVRQSGSPIFVGVVLSIQGGDLSPGQSVPFSIDYWTLEFDGTRLGRSPFDFVFKPFAGVKRISELEVSPCDYYDAADSGVLREELINRGQKFWRFLSGSQVDYMGDLPRDQSEWQGRVIIDPMTYYRYSYKDKDHPPGFWGPLLPTVGNIQDSGFELQPPPAAQRQPPGISWPKAQDLLGGPNQRSQFKGPPRKDSGRWAEYDNIIPGPDNRSLELIDNVTGETDMSRYLMCPTYVIGFDLKARQWHKFYVACCHDAVFNHSAIDSLVMKEERKSVIRSLVHRYSAPDATADETPVRKPWTADFIKNKGEGQIFLLHGSPGVGKTYTAECIAEATRRPLLSLTCGDIGTNEVTAEQKLSKWFRLAEIWGAVMLLDEADVFLEKRTMSDLQRNSLVSVFLRIVEYYRGILFLTTNRVGQFDDAFISRIHTVIHYENLSHDEQQTLWKQFFAKLEKERWGDVRTDYSATNYVYKSKDLRQIEWNGRQIRNAFQTAVALAEYRFLQMKPEERKLRGKASLEDQDFAKVCEMTIAFQGYMTSIHGGDEARRARLERIRDDKFKEASSSL